MQAYRVLIERLYVACKADAIYEKHRDENALLAKRIQKLVLQAVILIGHGYLRGKRRLCHKSWRS